MRIGERKLSELSDAELSAEVAARRTARAGANRRQNPPVLSKRLRQHYLDLELKPGAGLNEIRAQYQRLVAKYHPDKHAGNPEKHRAALRLTRGLTTAYSALLSLHEAE